MTEEELKKAKEELEKKQKEVEEKEKLLAETDKKKKEKEIEKFPEEAQKIIKELREENANRRVKNKEIEEKATKMEKQFTELQDKLTKVFGGGKETEEKPEELAAKLKKETEKVKNQQRFISLAYENNIKKENIDYFRYLVEQSERTLTDGQELPKQALDDIVKKVNAVSGSNKNTTSAGGDPPKGEGAGTTNVSSVTLDEFKKMSLLERSNLYHSSAEVYNKLEAKLLQSKGGSLIQ